MKRIRKLTVYPSPGRKGARSGTTYEISADALVTGQMQRDGTFSLYVLSSTGALKLNPVGTFTMGAIEEVSE